MPAAAAFAPHGEGQPSAEPGRVAVLGLAGDPNFCAPRVSLGLQHDATAHGLPVTFSALEVHLPGLDDLTRTSPLALAKAFDDMALAQHLAQQLRGRLQGISTLLTPPVLGLQRFAATRDYLCTALGIPVVEALGHMPTVPGFRLQQALEAAVQRAGVRCLGAVQALQLQGSAEKETASSAAGPLSCAIADGQTLRPDALVLCTGRFIAGGLLFKGRCTEPLLDLPVVTEMGRLEVDSPHSVVRPTPSESHPLMTAGVQVNRRLQPLRDGQVAHPSLFAAGMLLSGFASRFALCADGVALCTGFLAGSLAAEAVPS
jgi:glycerol-3-phosphate dehydrogenase subunit B